MPGYPSEPTVSQIAGPMLIGPFGVAAIALSQAAVAMKFGVNDATTGSNLNTGMPMPYAGSIVGIVEVMNTNKTAGVLGISPTINGTEIGSTIPLYRQAMANTALKVTKNVDGGQPGLRFNAGDVIGAKITTDGSFAPSASADILCWLMVMFEQFQP